VGEIPGQHRIVVKGCPEPRKADVIGSCAEEDCSSAEGEMGTGEGGKEDGLTFFIGCGKREETGT